MAEPRVSLERHTREDPHRHDRVTGRRRTRHRRTAGTQREGATRRTRQDEGEGDGSTQRGGDAHGAIVGSVM